jgi:hypothetical protein
MLKASLKYITLNVDTIVTKMKKIKNFRVLEGTIDVPLD